MEDKIINFQTRNIQHTNFYKIKMSHIVKINYKIGKC